jgi:hypothetical protein
MRLFVGAYLGYNLHTFVRKLIWEILFKLKLWEEKHRNFLPLRLIPLLDFLYVLEALEHV